MIASRQTHALPPKASNARKIPHARARRAGIAADHPHLSLLAQGELANGAELGTRKAASLADVRDLTAVRPQLPFDADVAMPHASIRAAQERKRSMIGQLNCQITVQSVAPEPVPVADNLRAFRRMPSLHCENWMRLAIAAP